MDDGGGNDGGSFKVEHRSHAAEIAYVHKAVAGDVGAWARDANNAPKNKRHNPSHAQRMIGPFTKLFPQL